jgi:hypothetical protein
MLLTELLKLFSTNFDINEERFVNIIESNNIKLSQRLLFELIDDKKTTKNSNNKANDLTNDPSNTINITNTGDLEINLLKKEQTSGRGRGRPRKTKDLKEEDDVILEVELLIIGEKEYYKTRENVILNKELEIEGIYVDGKVVRKDVK